MAPSPAVPPESSFSPSFAQVRGATALALELKRQPIPSSAIAARGTARKRQGAPVATTARIRRVDSGVAAVIGPGAAKRGPWNNASKVTPPLEERCEKESKCRRLWELQDLAQKLSPGRVLGYTDDGTPRLSSRAKCRRVRVGSGVELRAHTSAPGTTTTSFNGLSTCRSVWECPVCSRRVRADYAAVVRRVADQWQQRGGRAYLVSFTVRHAFTDSIAELSPKLAKAWQAMQRGAPWLRFKARRRFETVRSIEATWGVNGWHPHVHCVLFVPHGVELDLEADADWLHDRWVSCVEKEIGSEFVPNRHHGTDLRPLKVDDYIVKIGAELTDAAASKKAKNGNLTTWEVLAAAGSDPRMVQVWQEYCVGMRGRRFLTWSRGLKPMRELAESQLESERDAELESQRVVDVLSAREWDSLRSLPDFRCEILLAAAKGLPAVKEVLCEFKELRDWRGNEQKGDGRSELEEQRREEGRGADRLAAVATRGAEGRAGGRPPPVGGSQSSRGQKPGSSRRDGARSG